MSAPDGLPRKEEDGSALQFAKRTIHASGLHLVRLGKPTLPTLTNLALQATAWQAVSGRQADRSWLHLSRKQDPCKRRWEHYPRLPPSFALDRPQSDQSEGCPPEPRQRRAVDPAQSCGWQANCQLTLNERKPMRSTKRYQSQLLPRWSYKPNRRLRIRPVKLKFSFRPVRFGMKPQINTVP